MKILHVLSQTQPTGAESYALTLAEHQLRAGHAVTIVSDELHFPTKAKFLAQPIHNRTYLQRLKNVRFLRKLIQEEKIDVIHAHSRAASWVSYYAAIGNKLPLISTVHGRQHLHASLKLHDIYGDRVIAICKNVADHLKNEVGMESIKIREIPNALDFDDLDRIAKDAPGPQAGKISLAIAGRTTGPKGDRTGELLATTIPQLLNKYSSLNVEVFGGERKDLSSVAQANLSAVEKKHPTRLRFLGFLPGDEMYKAILRQNIVVGSGRIAMSALYFGKTVVALGEAATHGVVREKNFSEALASNFGDISAKKSAAIPDLSLAQKDLEEFLQRDEPRPSLRQKILGTYSSQKIIAAVENEYLSVIAKLQHPSHIPILMYHRVVDAPIETKHRIFVTKETFENHLSFLKERGFTPITFREYDAYRSGRKPWITFPKKPVILTLDDAYLDNYTNALPLLKKFGFSAVIFALGDTNITHNEWDAKTGEAPRVPLMNVAQMREMTAAGVELGAHSMTHSHFTKITPQMVERELVDSKRNLEEALGAPVIAFAYPYGDYSEETKNLTAAAGYKFGIATDTGALHIEDDPFAIFRASIFPEDTAAQLKKKTSSWYRKYYFWKRGK
jgi:peptidoglycan/xylan/chitin deacetylase (PgdA/CDA1 family)/glycosyltransferase involved in cell wall biosynthesis